MVRLDVGGDGVRLEVADDGVGFDPTAACPGHLGLRSMRERMARLGGTLEVATERGRGTRELAHVPAL